MCHPRNVNCRSFEVTQLPSQMECLADVGRNGSPNYSSIHEGEDKIHMFHHLLTAIWTSKGKKTKTNLKPPKSQ